MKLLSCELFQSDTPLTGLRAQLVEAADGSSGAVVGS